MRRLIRRRDLTGHAVIATDRLAREATRRLAAGWSWAQVVNWVNHSRRRARYGDLAVWSVLAVLGVNP